MVHSFSYSLILIVWSFMFMYNKYYLGYKTEMYVCMCELDGFLL